MTTLFSDAFTRSGTTVGATWTETPSANWSTNGTQLECDALSFATCITTTLAHAAAADCKASVVRRNSSWDAGIAIRSDAAANNCYFLNTYGSNGVTVWRRVGGANTAVAARDTAHANGDKFTFEASGSGATVTLKVYKNDAQVGADVTDTSGSRITAAGQTGVIYFQTGQNALYDDFLVEDLAGSVASLSSGTPSGTIGTQTTATIGATTNQTSGTLYVVVDSAGNLSGVTAAQVKAGQKASGSAALAANSAAVSTSTPSAGVTGLTANTAYSYAIVQNNTNGDSSLITGTFTTANVIPTITSVGGDNSVFNGETSVIIVGTNFGASQGSGKVYLSPTDAVGNGSRVEQTVTAWADTSITISVVKGGLSLDTNVYGFVVNNAGNSNAAGKVCQINSRPYVRDTLIDKNGAAVASLTGVVMLVWRADPTTGAPNPNEALTVATNGAGQLNQLITRGALAPNDPVWIALFKPGSPAKGTARKITPVYE